MANTFAYKNMTNKKNTTPQVDLSRLKGADRIRKRVGVVLGSDDIFGVKQTLFEIISNSIDRFKAGCGTKINIIKHKDNSFTVEDFANGLPMIWNEKEKAYNWELALRVLWAGGNYNVKTEEHDGQLGLNGLGLASTQMSSEFMIVTSYKEDFIYVVKFKEGRPVHKETGEFLCEDVDETMSQELGEQALLVKPNNTGRTGTHIYYKPDSTIFSDTSIPIEWLKDKIKKQAVVNSGLVINLFDEETNQNYSYLYEKGIADYIDELSETPFVPTYTISGEGMGRDNAEQEDYKVSFELAFNFNNTFNLVECYHNSSELLEGGSTLDAIKTGFVAAIHKQIEKRGLYNKNEPKIKYNDVQDSLVCIISSYSSKTSFANQTKLSIRNKFIKSFITDKIKKELEIYFIENVLECEKIINQILVNKRSRERAEKTRINIKKQLSGSIDITNRIKKFIDCKEKDPSLRELYIVEGDSALGSCKLGRNASFQAIMAIRGKILNCLKADYEKIFKSEIIVDLIKVMGCGVEIKTKHNKDVENFDLSKLRFDKVIICTDADIDGMQIRTLILTMIFELMPTLIKEGKVFIVESPLFEITSHKSKKNEEKTFFAYSESEKDRILKTLDNKCSVQRSKGLGENTPEMMWNTTMNPETRRLFKITMEDMELAKEAFELFLGDQVEPRKNYMFENGHKYIDETEVSE